MIKYECTPKWTFVSASFQNTKLRNTLNVHQLVRTRRSTHIRKYYLPPFKGGTKMGAPKLHLVKGCGSNGWHSIIPLTQSQKRKQRSENTAVAIQDDANKQTGDAM